LVYLNTLQLAKHLLMC